MRCSFLLLFLGLVACEQSEFVPDFNIESVEGLRPIYADPSELEIKLQDAKEINRAGKIYSYGDLLIVNEIGEGFHILNNANPKNPLNLHFVSVPGNSDVAIKNGIIYADSFNDLLAMEISQDTVIVLKRIEDLTGSSGDYPLQHGVYFECVDNSKGLVVGWETAVLNKPQCYRR